MEYAIYRYSTHDSVDTLSMHVLARAYRCAWWGMYACEPVGRHIIEGLDLLIEFPRRPGLRGN